MADESGTTPPPESPSSIFTLAHEMINQDNRMTSCPLWMVDSLAGPRCFFTAARAEKYHSEALHRHGPRVYSAHDNVEMLLVMGTILIEAGLEDHPETHNAYWPAIMVARAGIPPLEEQ